MKIKVKRKLKIKVINKNYRTQAKRKLKIKMINKDYQNGFLGIDLKAIKTKKKRIKLLLRKGKRKLRIKHSKIKII